MEAADRGVERPRRGRRNRAYVQEGEEVDRDFAYNDHPLAGTGYHSAETTLAAAAPPATKVDSGYYHDVEGRRRAQATRPWAEAAAEIERQRELIYYADWISK